MCIKESEIKQKEMQDLNIKIIQEIKQKMEGFVSKTLNQVRDTIG